VRRALRDARGSGAYGAAGRPRGETLSSAPMGKTEQLSRHALSWKNILSGCVPKSGATWHVMVVHAHTADEGLVGSACQLQPPSSSSPDSGRHLHALAARSLKLHPTASVPK
jgi:hypothetical protein